MNYKYQQRYNELYKNNLSRFYKFSSYFRKIKVLFLIFQLIVEVWESTNTLKETSKNIQEKKGCDLRDNLINFAR